MLSTCKRLGGEVSEWLRHARGFLSALPPFWLFAKGGHTRYGAAPFGVGPLLVADLGVQGWAYSIIPLPLVNHCLFSSPTLVTVPLSLIGWLLLGGRTKEAALLQKFGACRFSAVATSCLSFLTNHRRATSLYRMYYQWQPWLLAPFYWQAALFIGRLPFSLAGNW